MTGRRGIAAALALALAPGACTLPKDPEETTERVRGGTIRVGVLPGNSEAEAQDRAIVALLGEAMDAAPSFQPNDAHALFHALKEGQLDLVIGGLSASTPFVSEAGLSREAGPLFRPDDERKRVLAVRQGENGFLLAVNRAIHAHRSRGGT